MKKIIAISLVASLIVASDVELEKIEVVSGANTVQEIRDVTSNIEIITAKDLELGHYQSIVDVLNEVSGISYSRNGGFGQTTSLYIRGMETSKMVVLINGIRFNNPNSLNGADLGFLQLSNIERIEIVKGAQSSIWGADASAGVINIITKNPKDGATVEFVDEYGNYNTNKKSLNFGYKTGDISVSIGGENISSDGYSSKVTDINKMDSYEADGFTTKNVNTKIKYNIAKIGYFEIFSSDTQSSIEYDSSSADDTNAKVTLHEIISGAKLDIGNEFILLSSYLNGSYFDVDYSGYKSRANVGQLGANIRLSYLDNSFMVVGGDVKSFLDLIDNTNEYSSKSWYITNQNNLFDSTILLESLNYELNTKYDNTLTYKLGIKQFINDFYLSANYGTGYNAPSFYQQSKNSNLTPESTTTYDVSVGYENIQLGVFLNQVTNLIEYQGSWPNDTYNNISGTSTIKGLEASYKEKYKAISTKINANYTYLIARDKDDNRLARRPISQAYIGIVYYGLEKIDFNLNGTYIGKRYDSLNEQGTMTGEYTLVNFIANYKLDDKIKLYAKIDNLTDVIYQVVDGYGSARRSIYMGLNGSF